MCPLTKNVAIFPYLHNMKHLLIIAFVALFTCKASAQKSVRINASEVARYLGRPVSVTDSVYGYKLTAKATFIYMGGAYPKQLLTVILKGDAIAEPNFFAHSIITAHGTVVKRRQRLELVISDPEYFTVRRTAITGYQPEITTVLAGSMNPERPRLPLSELKEHIGKDFYVFDTITHRKVVSDSLTYLYLGGAYPNHLLTVILKGIRVNKDLSYLSMFSGSRFSGVLDLIDGKPTMVVTNRGQVDKQILL